MAGSVLFGVIFVVVLLLIPGGIASPFSLVRDATTRGASYEPVRDPAERRS